MLKTDAPTAPRAAETTRDHSWDKVPGADDGYQWWTCAACLRDCTTAADEASVVGPCPAGDSTRDPDALIQRIRELEAAALKATRLLYGQSTPRDAVRARNVLFDVTTALRSWDHEHNTSRAEG